MPAAKMIPVFDEDGKKIGERFEVTDEFVEACRKNYVEVKDSDGRIVRVNKTLFHGRREAVTEETEER